MELKSAASLGYFLHEIQSFGRCLIASEETADVQEEFLREEHIFDPFSSKYERPAKYWNIDLNQRILDNFLVRNNSGGMNLV